MWSINTSTLIFNPHYKRRYLSLITRFLAFAEDETLLFAEDETLLFAEEKN